ncbi:MAG: TonB-dependent receptor [Acidobacteriota bacterium]
MGARAKLAILLVAAWGLPARADDPSPSPPLSDADLLKMSQQETIEIYDERPTKPFDRDTEVRLTGEQLAARGATDLATALALLPDVTVRVAGRGGFQVDIRGARKGEVSILIDGVLVSDPYYGNFDVTTIPITDIVQIRVATTPQSPIDGPGGPGGVIEVHTRDAIGGQLVIARATADSLPSFGASATTRVALARHLALRLSGSGLAGARDLPLPMAATLGESKHAATGAARLEYRDGDRRVVVDAFLDDRHFIEPPSDTGPSAILLLDRDTSQRVSVRADDKLGELQVQGGAWVHYLLRRTYYYSDPALQQQSNFEDLSALRTGAMALATRPITKEARWAASATVDHEHADVDNRPQASAHGSVTMVELAADGQYEHRTVRVDAAAGLAIPAGVDADPWPEAKLVGRWRPSFGPLELTATAGRKGRVPSLRERFDPLIGNPKLGPEQVDHAEVRAIEHVDERAQLEVAPFYRHTTGLIRTPTGTMTMMPLINTGKLNIYGVDALARWHVTPVVELDAGYEYIAAHSDTSDNPLDFLPHHHGEVTAIVTPMARLAAVARVRYFSDATDGGQIVPGYTLVEASVNAQLSREYMGVLRVDDLLDAQPELRAGYHSPGRVISLVLQASCE